MKVSELIEQLKTCNPDAEIIMSKDAEGNDHSPLANLDSTFYVAESTWSGFLVQEPENSNCAAAVVFWPIN